MQFITASLGVECGYCHVEGHFEKDDKKAKQTAREMMKMMAAINANHFDGVREVTCYSCHRGAAESAGTPAVGMRVDTAVGAKLSANLPTVEQVLERYVASLGGADAIAKIRSRVETGSATVEGKSTRVEIFTEAPDKWALVRHVAEGESASVFDGKNGWFGIAGHAAREMHAGDLEAARMDADLQFALHVQEMFPELRVEYPERVGEREAYVLLGAREGRPAAKFYFDEASGLLVRVIRYADSVLGLNASEVEYGDYRYVDGVKAPFRVTRVALGERLAIEIEDVRQNVEIGAGRFGKPGT
jgi:hypothetical protein